MITQIITCLLLVVLSECGVVPPEYASDSGEMDYVVKPSSLDTQERYRRGNDYSDDDYYYNDDDDFRRVSSGHSWNRYSQEGENKKVQRGIAYWDLFSNYILPAVSKAMAYATPRKNYRRSSMRDNSQQEKAYDTNLSSGDFPEKETDEHNAAKRCHSKMRRLRKRMQLYPVPGKELQQSPKTKNSSENDDDAPSSRMFGFVNPFIKPILSAFGGSKKSVTTHHLAELASLEDARQDIQTAQAAKEQNQAEAMSEKMKLEAEINRLGAEKELLEKQRESERVEKKMSQMSEEKLKTMQEELLHKMQREQELEISKIRQENSKLLNTFQQLTTQSNNEIIHHTVIQPITEFRPAVNDFQQQLMEKTTTTLRPPGQSNNVEHPDSTVQPVVENRPAMTNGDSGQQSSTDQLMVSEFSDPLNNFVHGNNQAVGAIIGDSMPYCDEL